MPITRRWMGACCAVALFSGASSWAGDADWQLWFDASAEGMLTEQNKVKVNQQFKWKEDVSDLKEYHTQVGIYHPLADWLSVAGHYRQQYNKSGDDWNEENRLLGDVLLKTKIAGFSIQDRNRFEMRYRDDRTDTFRYRNKVSVYTPTTWTGWSLQPYVEDEIFIDSDAEELNRNRFAAGLKFRPAEKLKSTVYWQWEANEKNDDWTDVYIAGFKAGLVF